MKGCLSTLAIIVALIFAVPFGCALVEGYGRSDMARPSAATPPIDATPDQILSAFQANEVAAKDRYGAAPVRLTGRVSRISLNLTGASILGMEPSSGGEVQAHMLDSSKSWVSGLSVGSGVAVLCDNPSYIMGLPVLEHCVPTTLPAGAFEPKPASHHKHHHRR